MMFCKIFFSLLIFLISHCANAQVWYGDKETGDAILTPVGIDGTKFTSFSVSVKWYRVTRNFGEYAGGTFSEVNADLSYNPDESSEDRGKTASCVLVFSENLTNAELAAQEIYQSSGADDVLNKIDKINHTVRGNYKNVFVLRSKGFLEPGTSERLKLVKRAHWDDLNYCVVAVITNREYDPITSKARRDQSNHRAINDNDAENSEDRLRRLPTKDSAYRQQREIEASENTATQILRSRKQRTRKHNPQP